MKKFYAKVLELPTTIQDYRFNCPQFNVRLGYIHNDHNGKVDYSRVAEIKNKKLRSQARALYELVEQTAAIIWTLLDMPLKEYGLTVKKAIELIETEEYRKCALATWDEWESYANPRLTVDIRTRILSMQVVPKGLEFNSNMTQATVDKWCNKFGLTTWYEWTPRKVKDKYGNTIYQ